MIESAFNDGAQQLLPEFIERFKPPFPMGFNDRAAVLGFLQRSVMDMQRFYVPQMVFIDRRGMIRAEYPGESEFFQGDTPRKIRAELDKLLSAAPAASKKSVPKKKK